jgi:hypothetical protein
VPLKVTSFGCRSRHEGSDQLSLSALADMGCTQSDYLPWAGTCFVPSNKRAYANDRVRVFENSETVLLAICSGR